ncbi:MAG: 3-phosphoshikimate 1-carboxyvinyltransferase [Myxococcales bacterium]|nr:3-phosphoshikimate 1-carboxyvinyltransferase [Myxococcales bacterium]
MASCTFTRPDGLRGTATVPGDKSISHRALLLAALCPSRTSIRHLGSGSDVRVTARCLIQMGLKVRIEGDGAEVDGTPLEQWQSPATLLDCGNSGTTLRLLVGLLAGARGPADGHGPNGGLRALLAGDASLNRRPMRRVALPLHEMGADVEVSEAGTAPVIVNGKALRGTGHLLDLASAQVKGALLLAALHADGASWVEEPARSRDHTERMLAGFGASVRIDGLRIGIEPGPLVSPGCIEVPGDPSSAAFLVAAAVLHPDAAVRIVGVSLNPTRTGFVAALQRMGAAVAAESEADVGGELVGTVAARSSRLQAVHIPASEVPACIDELPILALCAACAEGTSVFDGVAELRVKESDRMDATVRLIRALGVTVRTVADRIEVDGLGAARHLRALARPFAVGLDHRIALCAAVAGLVGNGAVTVPDFDAADTSFPGFVAVVQRLVAGP